MKKISELNNKQIIAISISILLIVILTLTVMGKVPAELFWVLILISWLIIRKFFPKVSKK